VFFKLSFITGVYYSLTYELPASYLRVTLYIYRSFYYNYCLFFNPLKYSLLYFNIGYILAAVIGHPVTPYIRPPVSTNLITRDRL
jgi:hypothetical protein